MAKPKAEIIIGARNEASAVAKEVGDDVKGIGDKAVEGAVGVTFITEAIQRLGGAAMEFLNKGLDMNRTLSRSVIAMNDADMTTQKLGAAIKSTAADHLDGVFSANQVAEAYAGISAEGRGLEGTLSLVREGMNLAAATGVDLVTAVESIEATLDVYNMKVEDADHITSVLVNTWQSTGAPVEELVAQLRAAGQVSGAIGSDFDQLASIMGYLKNESVDSARGLLTAYQQMAAGSTYAKELLEKFDVAIKDNNGNLRSMTVVLTELKERGAEDADVFEAFGVRSQSALIALLENLDKVNDLAGSNSEAYGLAAEAGESYADSVGGEADKMTSAWEDLQLELSEGLLPALMSIMEVIRPLLLVLTQYPGIIYGLIGAWVLYKIAKLAVTAVEWGHTAAVAAHTAITGASTVATWSLTGAIWASTAALLANPITWIVLLIVGLVLVLWQLEERFGTLTWIVEMLWEGFKGLGKAVMWLWENSFKVLLNGLEWGYDNILKPWWEILEKIIDGLKTAGDWMGGAADAVGGMFGFKEGTDFIVGGAGGPDSQLLMAKVSPGERVQVTPAHAIPAGGGGGGGGVHNHYYNFPNVHDAEGVRRVIQKTHHRRGRWATS